MTILVRRDTNGGKVEYDFDMGDLPPIEVASEPQRPTSRVVRFDIPDGYMATISLVPYTEPLTEPSEPDPA